MKRKSVIILLAILCLLMPYTSLAEFRLTVKQSIPMAKAVKGHYAGMVGDNFASWGGYFRRVNPYVGEERDYYEPFAFGASVQVPQGVLFLGGLTGTYVSSLCILRRDITRYRQNSAWRYDGSSLEYRDRMSIAVYRHAAALVGGKRIIVAGGIRDSITPNEQVVCMDWPDGKGWTRLANMPGAARLSPIAIEAGGDLLLVGGCTDGGNNLDYSTWQKSGLRYDVSADEWTPIDWNSVPDSLFPAAGGVAMPVGRFTTAFMGGCERDGSYRSHIVIYNRLFDSWSYLTGDTLLARVDAILSSNQNGYAMLSGGEVSPGKVSSDVIHVILLPHGWAVEHYLILLVILLALLVLAWRFFRKK